MRKKIYTTKIESLDAAKDKAIDIKTYSDKTKFIDFDKYNNGINNQYLEEFPEYLAGYIPFATNTGLMCFYKDSTLVVYDLTEEDKTINLDSINPDTSLFIDYNYISTPVNIRKINYRYNENYYFTADKKYIFNSEIYSFFNCDKIKDSVSNDNGYFKSEDNIDIVIYYYKPIIYIRAYKNDGSKQTSLIIKVNGNNMQKNGNIYYYDCSDITVGRDLKLTLDNNNVGDGYLEVL